MKIESETTMTTVTSMPHSIPPIAPSLRVPVTSRNREMLRRLRAAEMFVGEAADRNPPGKAPASVHQPLLCRLNAITEFQLITIQSMKIIKYLTVGLAAMTLTCTPAFSATTSELLQQGLYAEEVEGNLDSAIKSYNQVIQTKSAPPNQVAQALYRQGMCYLKIKDEAAARTVLAKKKKLVAEYSSQTELAEKARPVLDDLTDFDPAALMPPGTLVYMEFGSPGRQIETILTMLKDTPFENPLAARKGNNGRQKSPGDIMGALLNPEHDGRVQKSAVQRSESPASDATSRRWFLCCIPARATRCAV